jgi:hypothetical protein
MRKGRGILVIAAWALCVPDAALAGGPGVSAGVTRTTLTATGWSAAAGFDVGLFATIATFKGISLQPEIRYVRKVPERRIGDGAATISSALTLDFVEVPVVLRVPLRRERRLTPVVFAGIYAACRVRARSRIEIGESSYEEDLADATRRWHSGVLAGAGLEVRGGPVTWLTEARYSQGLTAVGTHEGTNDWSTRTVTVLAGVAWGH